MYFVAVDSEEMAYTKDTLVANSIEQIKYDDGLYILVFDRNVFEDLVYNVLDNFGCSYMAF